MSNTLVWKTIDFVLGPGEQIFFETLNRLGPGSVFCLLALGAGSALCHAPQDELTMG